MLSNHSLKLHYKLNNVEEIVGSPTSQASANADNGTRPWFITASERENAAIFLQFTNVVPFTLLHSNYKCFYCDEKFKEVKLVIQHTETHTVPKQFSLIDKYARGKQRIKVDASDLKCRICELKYANLDDIKEHLITAHKKEFNNSGHGLMAYNLNTPSGLLACHTCGMEFRSFITLNRHINVHETLVCEICGLGFSTHQRLKHHMITHQNANFACSKCQKVFPTTIKLRYHTDHHHDPKENKKKPQKCPHCLERFTGHSSKMTHIRKVHGIVFKFECEACNSIFLTQSALSRHRTKVHIQNLLCQVCGKSFGTRDKLKEHERIHTGEKNFVCAICKNAYMHEKVLSVHMKTHGYKFTCFKCGLGFLEKDDLNEHKKKEHVEQS